MGMPTFFLPPRRDVKKGARDAEKRHGFTWEGQTIKKSLTEMVPGSSRLRASSVMANQKQKVSFASLSHSLDGQ